MFLNVQTWVGDANTKLNKNMKMKNSIKRFNESEVNEGMENVKDYNEYKELFNSELVVAVRAVLNKIENGDINDLEDSVEHNRLIRYFNKFALHKIIDETRFKNWK
jgi:hypothetical protein